MKLQGVIIIKTRRIVINYSFILFLILMLYMMKITEIIIISLSIFLHEIGHFLVAYIFNINKFSLEISMFGSVCKMDVASLTRSKKIILYSAGIIVNILIIIIFYNLDYKFSKTIIHYNLLMMIISCMPIYPLDGYNIITQIFRNKIGLIKIISFISLFIFIILSKSFGLLLIFLYLLYKQKEEKEVNEYKYLKYLTTNKRFIV